MISIFISHHDSLYTFNSIFAILFSSVVYPDQDPSGSGFFHHQAKKTVKYLWFLLLCDFFMTLCTGALSNALLISLLISFCTILASAGFSIITTSSFLVLHSIPPQPYATERPLFYLADQLENSAKRSRLTSNNQRLISCCAAIAGAVIAKCGR